jgi:protein ERP2
MDWQIGKEEFPTQLHRTGPMNQLDRSVETIADRLRIIDDYQTHHRLREATGRKRAEDLNERVTFWSLGQTAIVILVGIGQVKIIDILSLSIIFAL